MRYQPTQISADDFKIATNQSVGGEKRLYVSRENAFEVGRLDFTADNQSAWTADEINTLPASGVDLHVGVNHEAVSDAPIVVTVVGTDQDDVLLSGIATLQPPAWVSNKRYDFAEGHAVDVVPNGTGKRFKTITSVAATPGRKRTKLKLFSLPSAGSWVYIDTVENVSAKIGTSSGHALPDGLDGAKRVTRNRSDVPTLEISTLYRSVADGLQRWAGRQVCYRMDVHKQGNVQTESHVYCNAILEVNPNFPDGSDEVKVAASGVMEDYLGFWAL